MAVIILLICLSLQSLQAQTILRGIVADGNGRPIPKSTVLLLRSADSSLVRGTVSDNGGSYVFNAVPAGKYLLSFSFVGFKQVYSASYIVTESQENISIGETRLIEKDISLNEVTITAKKPLFEQKIDRLVVNVRNSLTAVGGNALEVLERSPGVVVDRQNSVLTMAGKEGVQVMINGRETHMPADAVIQMLAGMNAANIERIELITTPPASFSAEGNAGIISIILVENNKVGTNGNFSVIAGLGQKSMIATAVNLNHRAEKWNLFADYSFTRNDIRQPFSNYRKVEFGGKVFETSLTNDRRPTSTNFNGRMGVDVQLTPNTAIGGLVTGYTDRWVMNSNSNASMSVDRQLDTIIEVINHEVNYWTSFTTNLNVRHTFNKNTRASVNIDYLYYHADNPNYFQNAYSDGAGNYLFNRDVRNDKKTPISFWIGSGDMVQKVGKNNELQAGIKFTFSGFKNNILIERLNQDTWIKDPAYSAEYTLDERVAAAYISYTANPNPKTNIKMGLRYEYTVSNLSTREIPNIVDRHYGRLFPSFFISRKLTDQNIINFSYARRITRPGFNDLAPFTIFPEPNSLTTGNPALQPAIADAISTSWSYKNYILSLSYSHEDGAIAKFQTRVDAAANKQVSSPENFNNLKTSALTLSVPVVLTKWWSMQYNVIARWQQGNSRYNAKNVRVEQRNIRVSSTQSFKLPLSFAIDISGYYQSGELRGRYLLMPVGALDIGIQKKIERGAGRLTFTVTDIFNSSKFKSYMDIPEQHGVLRRNLQFAQRLFKLTYARSFGNSKLETKRNRSDSSDEERKRVE